MYLIEKKAEEIVKDNIKELSRQLEFRYVGIEEKEIKEIIRENLIKAAVRVLTSYYGGRGRIREGRYLRYYFPKDMPLPLKKVEIEKAYTVRDLINRITLGHLDWIKGVWNGDFIFGLKVGGAIRERKEGWVVGRYNCKKNIIYVALKKAISIIKSLRRIKPFQFRRYLDKNNGRTRMQSYILSYYPPETGTGPSVLAGILAAGEYKKGYIYLPFTEYTEELLSKHWGIKIEKIDGKIRVNEFYGILFGGWMPEEFREWINMVRRRGKKDKEGEKIGSSYWAIGYKGAIPSLYAMPLSWSEESLRERGYRRRDGSLHRLCRETGITHISEDLRKVLDKWVQKWENSKNVNKLNEKYIIKEIYRDLWG